MARAAVIIGSSKPMTEVPDDGIARDEYVERKFRATVTRLNNNMVSSGDVIDNLKMDMNFQIKMDKWTYENFQWLRYLVYNGAKWKITNVQVQRPNMIVQVGGIFNG